MDSTYKALVLEGAGRELELKTVSPEPLRPGEAAVRLYAAAINHRDLWIRKGSYAGLTYPVFPGSDGAGEVEQVGEGVDGGWVGRKVIINPSLNWGTSPDAPGKDFQILGMPSPGTFAERVTVPAANLAPMPSHLSFEEAAALPLSGLTGYRALFTRGRLRAGDKLLITGIGGGVAQFLLRFAVEAGARAWVTSGSPEKLAKGLALGALGGADYRQEGWNEKLLQEAGPFDCIVDSAGGPGFIKLCDLLRPGGRLVFFGATAGNPPILRSRKIFWNHLDLLGTTMGSPDEFAAMVRMVEEKKIKPVIDRVYPLAEAEQALKRMDEGGQFGKLVLRIRPG